MELSIVILNYRSAGLVKQCIKGIYQARPPGDFEIIVVDNHSRDDMGRIVQEFFPEVVFVPLAKNVGFAAGNNAGIRRARGEYVMILNPDIAVLPGSLEKMTAFLDRHTRVGMVVPQLLNPDRSIQYSVMRFPTFFLPLYRRTFLGNVPKIKKILSWYLMNDWDHASDRAVEWALGACMMVRRAALDQVGLFDEQFFLYVEDTDWCRRFWEKGWKIFYLSGSRMVHYHMRESAERFFSRLNIIHIVSWLKYFWKYRKGKEIKIS